jgi:hypothetical protein
LLVFKQFTYTESLKNRRGVPVPVPNKPKSGDMTAICGKNAAHSYVKKLLHHDTAVLVDVRQVC